DGRNRRWSLSHEGATITEMITSRHLLQKNYPRMQRHYRAQGRRFDGRRKDVADKAVQTTTRPHHISRVRPGESRRRICGVHEGRSKAARTECGHGFFKFIQLRLCEVSLRMIVGRGEMGH